MKKLKLTSLAIMALFTFLLVGCGGNSAKDVAVKSTEYLLKGNTDAYLKLVDAPKETKEMLKSLLDEKGVAEIKKELDKKEGIKSVVATGENLSEDGNKSTVEVKVVFGNGEEKNESVDLHKVDGKWMVDSPKK